MLTETSFLAQIEKLLVSSLYVNIAKHRGYNSYSRSPSVTSHGGPLLVCVTSHGFHY